MINRSIKELICYGLRTGLLDEEEEVYARNLLLDLLNESEYAEPDEVTADRPLAEILESMLAAAADKGIIGDSITEQDLFDTRIMNCITPRPAQVQHMFAEHYIKSPMKATDWYYRFSQDTNYIRRDRAVKNLVWKTDSEYGQIDITVNLAKPEKDPAAIAAAAKMKPSGYPKCLLCRENEGYAGHINHPARQTHRTIPVRIAGEKWYMQYSPYGYYNEHCILLSEEHRPMIIDKSCFRKLLDFVKLFPHYFIGSNADLPIVGGSILSHEHFQGGRYTFAMERAPIAIPYRINGYEDVESGIVCWPLSVFRIRSENPERLVELADLILNKWRTYTDEEAFIYAETDGEMHNTVTPIARRRDGLYELDLTLRNNIRTSERPDGLYHPDKKYHHIKKENIGLIEVMGLAVLPARLKSEMNSLSQIIIAGIESRMSIEDIAEAIKADKDLEKHFEWAMELMRTNKDINRDNADQIIKNEVGNVFVKVLEDAGVYKWTKKGHSAFLKFLREVSEH